MAEKKAHLHHPRDNVAVALDNLVKGDVVAVEKGGTETRVEIREAVPFGHKFALEAIERGGEVTKYGAFIGRATREIEVGEHVHVHNIKSEKYT